MKTFCQIKQFSLILLALFLFIFQFKPVFAASIHKIDDQAGLLEINDLTLISKELDRISQSYNTDIVILTLGTEMFISDLTEYADTYYEKQNLGLGATQSGLLFMISMAERDWTLATHGEAINIFNDYAQKQMMDRILPALSENNMSEAFQELAIFSELTLENYENGIIAEAGSSRSFLFYLLPPTLALLFTVIIMRSLKSALTSVGFHSGAVSYLVDDSLAIANANDFFLSSSIARTVIPKNTENRSSNGGSTTRTSSTGKTFGGSSGKF